MESWPAKKNMDSAVYKFSWLFSQVMAQAWN